MKAYVTCNKGFKSAQMEMNAARRFAKLLIKTGNVNVKVVRKCSA